MARTTSSNSANAGRLKPPATDVAKPPNSSRLKFNPPASTKGSQSNSLATDRPGDNKNRKESKSSARANEGKKPAEEKKTTVGAQKATSTRLATNSKQLFRKNPANSGNATASAAASSATSKPDLKSPESKDPSEASKAAANVGDASPLVTEQKQTEVSPNVENSVQNGQPKEAAVAMSAKAESQSSAQTPHVQLESSMCDERDDDSFCEKNSITEFEMLEKECFQDDTPQQDDGKGAQSNNSRPRQQVATLDLDKVKNSKNDGATA